RSSRTAPLRYRARGHLEGVLGFLPHSDIHPTGGLEGQVDVGAAGQGTFRADAFSSVANLRRFKNQTAVIGVIEDDLAFRVVDSQARLAATTSAQSAPGR